MLPSPSQKGILIQAKRMYRTQQEYINQIHFKSLSVLYQWSYESLLIEL